MTKIIMILLLVVNLDFVVNAITSSNDLDKTCTLTEQRGSHD